MKFKLTLIFLCLFFYFAAKAQSEISVRIANLKSDSVIINIGPVNDPESGKVDTLVLKNGMTKFPYKVKEFSQVIIIPLDLIHKFKNGRQYSLPGSRIIFYVNEADNINIDARIDDKLVLYSVKGNKFSEQFAEARQHQTLTFKNRYLFEAAYQEKSEKENTAEDERKYMAKRGANNLAYQNANISYVKKHYDSEVSPLLLLDVSAKDSVISLYSKLSKNVQNSYYGQKLGKLVRQWYITKPGQKLPELFATSIDGNSIQLSKYQGKFLLLDFWGSWCAPCLGEFPALKVFSQKYSAKLSLIGLICKDTKDNARAIIKSKSLNWTQLYSETDEFGPLFGITGYPTKILIDPYGTVLKTFIGVNDTVLDEIATIISK